MLTEKEVTIYDIARHLNISAATVSRGLKNNPAVKKNTRKKIADTAKALGYRSNAFASSLRSKHTYTIGVLVPRLNSYFMSCVLAGMENIANREGYNLIISQSLEEAEKEQANALNMLNKRVDGLLVSLAYNTMDFAHFEPFFKLKVPVVFFDRVYPNNESTAIVIDNYAAAFKVTSHLVEQGCKRIMHLGGNLLRNVYQERFEGYKAALAANNIVFDEQLHLVSGLTEEAGTEAAKFILNMAPGQRPDAVFSANDTAAVHCMIALKASGVSIPADIAFAGFNNDPVSKVIEPNLTTIDYSGHLVGSTAISNLINHFKGLSNLYMTHVVTLRADMIVRASSLKTKPAS